MTIDSSTGIWTPQDIDYWRTKNQEKLSQHPTIPFDISVGGDLFVLLSMHAEGLVAMDAMVGIIQTATIQQLQEEKNQIEGSKSITPSGMRSAFLSLAPLVQKCSIIQATVSREDWYIFLELNKSFTMVTEQEKEILLSMGSSTQGCGKLSSKYPDSSTKTIDGGTWATSLPRRATVTIEGEGMIDASNQKVGVYTILNEIQKTQMPKLLIKVVVLQGFEESVHYTTERVDILDAFKASFVEIQEIKVDFIKIDYAPIIHNVRRAEWIYEFNFYDNTDPENPIIKNQIVVNEYEYLILGEDDPVKISFYEQGTYNPNGTYTEGALIQ